MTTNEKTRKRIVVEVEVDGIDHATLSRAVNKVLDDGTVQDAIADAVDFSTGKRLRVFDARLAHIEAERAP